MDSLSSLEYVKDTLTNLIRTYHEHRLNEDYYEFQPTEGYEKSLQKLEREVREHIKIEHQMRLHIDNIQARLDESEKLRNESNSQSKRVIQGLRDDIEQLENRIVEAKPAQQKRRKSEYTQPLQNTENILNQMSHMSTLKSEGENNHRLGEKQSILINRSKENSQIHSNTMRPSSQCKVRSMETTCSQVRRMGKKRKRSASRRRDSVSPRGAYYATTATTRQSQKKTSLRRSVRRSGSAEKVKAKPDLYSTYRPNSSRLRH